MSSTTDLTRQQRLEQLGITPLPQHRVRRQQHVLSSLWTTCYRSAVVAAVALMVAAFICGVTGTWSVPTAIVWGVVGAALAVIGAIGASQFVWDELWWIDTSPASRRMPRSVRALADRLAAEFGPSNVYVHSCVVDPYLMMYTEHGIVCVAHWVGPVVLYNGAA